LQRFLLFVVSTDVPTLCAAPASPHPMHQIFGLNFEATENGVLKSGPVVVPESWRSLCSSFYFIPPQYKMSNYKPPSSLYYHQTASLAFVTPSDALARLPAFDEGPTTGSPMSASPVVTGMESAAAAEEAVSLGPTESQKACAHLLQRLAVEIIEAVLAYEAEHHS
uniref:DUF775 domain-containing protein n=1 Tax=Hydatigena taeniaeformis TaxID=6205 RepID=A0A0R3WVS6_HYDTA